MSSHPASGNGSFRSLSTEIDDIYRSYAAHNSAYARLLDSNDNEGGVALRLLAPADARPDRSATPLSTDSFDFHMPSHGITNSSLNVLLDTPSTELQYRDLVSTPPVIETGRPRLTRTGSHGSAGSRSSSASALQDASPDASDAADEPAEDPNGHEDAGDAHGDSNGDWAEKGAAERTTDGPYGYNVIRRTVKDFKFGKDLGEGSYSTVVLATDKLTSNKYAVKILDKRHIIKEKKVKYVNIEKHALNRLSHCPGIISLFFTFQDKHLLYFVLEYASNGELLGLIKQYGSLSEDCTRHLGAQILDAIRYMHDNGVIHRDIKPENILLDDQYRIRITDFGTAKLLEKKKHGESGEDEEYPLDVRAKSFVGTAEYVSPELLDSKYCGKPGDIWAFGCIMYQMVAGKPPFKATNEYLTFQKITKLQYAFSAGFPLILRDLIKQILVLQPSRRATIDQIKLHYFFHEYDFDDTDLIWATTIPELAPYKMTAKSMMKMPAGAQSAKQPTVIRKPAPKKASLETPPSRRVASDTNGKGFSPASVAAFVLTKQDEPEQEAAPLKPAPSQPQARAAPAPEYIPGTNILRPQIHTMANFSRSSISSRADSDSAKKQKSKVMEVTPPTAVEAAWQQYLTFAERVVHVGLAFVRKQPTEYFEKKHKGFIHEAPLGFSSKLLAISKGNGRSMLSHVAQGNKMRDVNEVLPMEEEKDENDAFTYYYETATIENIPEEEEKAAPTLITNSTTKIGKKLFKKLLHTDKKLDSTSDTASVASGGSGGSLRGHQLSADKARTCTVVVTTFGRALIFLRDDQNNDYKLVCDIKLVFPFIQFKEVITNGAKFSKLIPTTGVFAIRAPQTTFVFEVEKYEVTLWTEALAKAKLNQYERIREEEMKLKMPAKPTSKQKSSPKSSPKLMESPLFSPGNSRSTTRESSSHSHTHAQAHSSPRARDASPSTLDPREKNLNLNLSLLFQKKMKSSASIKRKPPPPLPSSNNLSSSGLGRESGRGESNTVHAAQLAVSNNPHLTMTDNRRSSFSREHNGSASHLSPTTSSGGAKITSMNSKFLARSRGKK